MWAGKILSLKDPGIIDSVGGLIISNDGIAKGRGRLEKDLGQYDREEEVFIPSACACLYRKEMLNEVGLLMNIFCILRRYRPRTEGEACRMENDFCTNSGRLPPLFRDNRRLWLRKGLPC